MKNWLREPLTPLRAVTVVAALGVLAAMVYFGYQEVSERIVEVRTDALAPRLYEYIRGQRDTLVAAVASYKSDKGFYPPDHVIRRAPLVVDAVTNQLLYELRGTIYNPTNETFCAPNSEPLKRDTLRGFFNVDEIRNASISPKPPKDFITNSAGFGAWEAHDSPDVNVLKPTPDWEGADWNLLARFDISAWRYISTGPVHNTNSFDLWVEIEHDGKKQVIGNWP